MQVSGIFAAVSITLTCVEHVANTAIVARQEVPETHDSGLFFSGAPHQCFTFRSLVFLEWRFFILSVLKKLVRFSGEGLPNIRES